MVSNGWRQQQPTSLAEATDVLADQNNALGRSVTASVAFCSSKHAGGLTPVVERIPKLRFVDSAQKDIFERFWRKLCDFFGKKNTDLWTVFAVFAFVDGPAGTMFWNSFHSRINYASKIR